MSGIKRNYFFLAQIVMSALIGCAFLLSGCDKSPKVYEYYDSVVPALTQEIAVTSVGFDDITQAEGQEMLVSEYGFTGLSSHSILEKDGQVIVNLYFSADTPIWQLRSARDFAWNTFFRGQFHNIKPLAYEDIGWRENTQKLYVQIFVDEALLLQDHYWGLYPKWQTAYYENARCSLNQQLISLDDSPKFTRAVGKCLPANATYICKNSISPVQFILQIQAQDQINPSKLPLLIDSLEHIKTDLPSKVIELYNDTGLYHRIILE